jgi:hypothetical protein
MSWSYGGATEEGWDYTAVTWSLDGGAISYEWFSDGSDCDGRLTRSGEYTARIESITKERDLTWIEVDSRQQDFTAEAAGY